MPVEGRGLTSGVLCEGVEGLEIDDESMNSAMDRGTPEEAGRCGEERAGTPRCGPFVCRSREPVGEPDAGNPHVRFDERDVETEYGRDAEAPATERAGKPLCSTYTTAPHLDSTIIY